MQNNFLLTTQYHQLREKIAPITLLAVSKSQPLYKIQALIKAGQCDFGENYLQEALTKISALQTLSINPLKHTQINWHYLGKLQSNKLQKIATYFNWVQTITTLKQASKLSLYRCLMPPHIPNLNLCIQVNISQSTNKQGVLPDIEALERLSNSIQLLPRIQLRGLMTITDPTETFNAQYGPFKSMAKLFSELQSRGLNLDTLSMGMSQEIDAAMAAGSTLLRIGTALFGPRG